MNRSGKGVRYSAMDAVLISKPIVEAIHATGADCIYAGSIRREQVEVGDVDLVVCGNITTDQILALLPEEHTIVLAKGPVKLRVIYRELQIDFQIATPESFGATLLYLTGSAGHNMGLRQRAKNRGMKLDEHGLWRDGERIAGETEHCIFHALDMEYKEPSKR